MKIPKKQLLRPSQSRRIVTLPDFGRMDALHDEGTLTGRDAPLILNFSCRKRVLTDGWGKRVFAEIPGERVGAMFCYRRYDGGRADCLVIWCRSGNFYQYGLYDGTGFVRLPFTMVRRPRGINYRLNGVDVLALCAPDGAMIVYDGRTGREIPSAPPVTSMCLHAERLFVTVAGERNAVWFSEDLDITNWEVSLEGAGFIEMADDGGSVLRAVAFAGHVYLFRRYSVARLDGYGDQSQFTLKSLYVSSGRLLEETVCVCGDRILFAAEDGIYLFDGLSTSKILERYDGYITFDDACRACWAGGRYLLSFGTGRKGLLIYDPETGEECLSDLDLPLLAPGNIEREDVVYAGDGSDKIYVLGEGLESPARVYESGRMTPKGGDRVRIAGFSLRTEREVIFTAETDEGEESFVLPGGGTFRRRCRLKGRTLRFRIRTSASGNRIGPPSFEILSLQ